MKNFIIVLTVCVIGSKSARITKVDEDKMLQHHTDCAGEAKIDLGIATQIVKTTEAKRNPEIDCFITCMLKAMDIMTEEGKLDERMLEERLIQQNLDKPRAQGVVTKCKGTQGKNECDLGGSLYDCFDFIHL